MAPPADLSVPPALPRILLITDVDVAPDCRGAGRTTANLFARWPAGRLMLLSSARGQPAMDGNGHRVVPAVGRISRAILSRLSRLAPFVGDASAWWAGARPLPGRAEVAAFAPDLVLVVPTTSETLQLGLRWSRALSRPVVTYLMDDWMSTAVASWPGGNAPAAAAALLRDSAAWLAISPFLAERLAAIAGVSRPAMVVHNPVSLPGEPPAALTAPRHGPFRIGYAGTVWPMHYDAIVVVAAAAARLRERGTDVRLVLHTGAYHWQAHAGEWARLGVEYGGLVPYDSLTPRLGEYDLLLVASSFEREQAPMTRSSIQTKVTDYMAVGRPILACGPADGACNVYLREHDCAWLLESRDPEEADAALARCIAGRDEGQRLAGRAYDVVRRDHEAGAVTARLYEFLAAAAAS